MRQLGESELVTRPVELAIEVAHLFEQLGIPYYLAGSLASSIHGEPRATRDIDFVAEIGAAQVEPFCRALGDAYYVDRETVAQAVIRHSHFNVVRLDSMLKVDVFLPADRTRFAEELRRSRVTGVGSDTLRVASAEDTVLAKLDWFRLGGEVSDRQWSDVVGVMRIQQETLDLGYLTGQAIARGLATLLERALAEARA